MCSGSRCIWAGLDARNRLFNRTAASAAASQLTLGVAALVIPAAFIFTSEPGQATPQLAEQLSLGVAFVLLASYIAQMIFFLRTHKHLYSSEEEEVMHGSTWSIRHAVLVLLGTTLVVAFMSDLLVEGVQYLTEQLGLTELFVGVILVALIGNAAEHLTAVVVAMKNKMDLAVNIAMGSALQIALFVAPVLVFAGFLTNHPLDLVFNLFEVVAVAVMLIIAIVITQDGESNWFEGLQLMATYVILAVAFFFHP